MSILRKSHSFPHELSYILCEEALLISVFLCCTFCWFPSQNTFADRSLLSCTSCEKGTWKAFPAWSVEAKVAPLRHWPSGVSTGAILAFKIRRKQIIFLGNANWPLSPSCNHTFSCSSVNVCPDVAAAPGRSDGVIDGGMNAGRGEMKRGIALTWRCYALLARDLTGTWAAASPWAAARLIADNVSICQSEFCFCFFFLGGVLLPENEKDLSQISFMYWFWSRLRWHCLLCSFYKSIIQQWNQYLWIYLFIFRSNGFQRATACFQRALNFPDPLIFHTIPLECIRWCPPAYTRLPFTVCEICVRFCTRTNAARLPRALLFPCPEMLIIWLKGVFKGWV